MQLRLAALIVGFAASVSCQLDQGGRAAVSPAVPPPGPPEPPPGSPGSPGTITDLAVAAVTGDSVALAFTEVDDGTGRSASYDFRYSVAPISWGSALVVTQGSCATPVTGTTIGAHHRCTVLGLTPGTSYQFQGVAFRGTLNGDAVFGELSNVVEGQP
jgi:hypothetical protein